MNPSIFCDFLEEITCNIEKKFSVLLQVAKKPDLLKIKVALNIQIEKSLLPSMIDALKRLFIPNFMQIYKYCKYLMTNESHKQVNVQWWMNNMIALNPAQVPSSANSLPQNRTARRINIFTARATHQTSWKRVVACDWVSPLPSRREQTTSWQFDLEWPKITQEIIRAGIAGTTPRVPRELGVIKYMVCPVGEALSIPRHFFFLRHTQPRRIVNRIGASLRWKFVPGKPHQKRLLNACWNDSLVKYSNQETNILSINLWLVRGQIRHAWKQKQKRAKPTWSPAKIKNKMNKKWDWWNILLHRNVLEFWWEHSRFAEKTHTNQQEPRSGTIGSNKKCIKVRKYAGRGKNRTTVI